MRYLTGSLADCVPTDFFSVLLFSYPYFKLLFDWHYITYKWISNFSIFLQDDGKEVRWGQRSLAQDYCQFVASSSDSEVANGSTEEADIGVAGAEPVKK